CFRGASGRGLNRGLRTRRARCEAECCQKNSAICTRNARVLSVVPVELAHLHSLQHTWVTLISPELCNNSFSRGRAVAPLGTKRMLRYKMLLNGNYDGCRRESIAYRTGYVGDWR